MTIKENLPLPSAMTTAHALSGFTLLALQGRDAEAFAHAQFMNDVRVLQVGQWQWSGWLTPKGRLIALFALLRRAEGELWLVLPDVDATALAERLQRFVFRSKLSLAPLTGWNAAAAWPASGPDDISPDYAFDVSEQALALDWGSPEHPRVLYLLADTHPALMPSEPANDARWLAADVAFGLPRLDASQMEAWTPQMLSLERLGAYSVKKGCYPGQEIVARTHFLGQAKRSLLRVAGTRLQRGQAITAGHQPAGQIVTATRDGKQGLAVVSQTETLPALEAEGMPCQTLPLLDGLRRPR